MGNDGGSIPKRRELVKEAARLPSASELKATALESLAHAWDTCPLSSEPLDPAGGTAVVSDWRGRLYSYESVLQCLASTSSSSSSSSETPSASIPETQQAEFARTGIRGLKDVVKLRFAVRRDERGRGFRACPVSMKELGAGSNARAVYVVPCGHVFAEVAIRETIGTTATATATNSDNNRGKGETETNGEEAEKQKQKQCPECSEPFQERDLIPILSTDEAELERLARRADELKALGLTHSLKKDKSGGGGGGSGGKSKNKKKRKAGGEDANDENGAKAHNAKEKKDDKNNSSSKSSSDKNGISSRINNSATASLTAKVLAEQEERNKRRKMVARSEAVR